jgi:predicted nucleotidyltransferase
MSCNQPNTFGLTERDMQTLTDIFQKYPEVKSVCLFGSRAKGTFKQGSDIDLAVMNEGVSDKTMRAIKADFEDSSLLYNVDVVDFAGVKHKELREHVRRVGVAIYDISE